MSLVFAAKTYVQDVARGPDILRYLGPAHTLSANDYVDLTRIAPKPTSDYAGKGRSRLKLTRGSTDGTARLGDVIVDLTISIPVGTQESEMDAVLADLASFLGTANAESFFQDQKLSL